MPVAVEVLFVAVPSPSQKALAAAMSARGWAVCEKADAARALAAAAAARFDLVVAGPEIRGMEMAAFCAALSGRPMVDRPVVVAIPCAAGDAAALIEAGADDCLPSRPGRADLEAALDIFAARAARHSRDVRFRDLFENASDAMFTATLDARITEANRGAEELTGYRRSELVGMSLADLIAPEQRGRGLEMVRRKVEGESTITRYESEIVSNSGSRIPVEVVSQVVLEDGGPVALHAVARDIADRRRIEEALRASEERFRSLVQNAFEVVTISDPDGTLRYVSPSVERLMGYTAEDWAGRSILSFIHPDDLPAASSGFANAVNSPGIREPLELRVRHRDGSWRVLETVAYNLLGDPAVRGIVHNSRDVTERRRAEDESARLAAIVESTGDAIIGRDAQGRIVSWNAGAERTYGFSAAEMLGTLGDPIVPPELLQERDRAGRRARAGEATDQFETVRLTRDGRRIEIAGSLFPIRNRAGEIIGNATIARDISEQKRNEEKLRKASEFTTSVVNTVSNAIASLALDGTITLANDRLVEMSGYSREELIGRRIETLVPPEEVTRLAGVILAANLGKAAGGVEARGLRKDGSLFDVSFSVAPLFEDGALTGFVGSAEDITERKKSEESLRLLAHLVDSSDEAIMGRTLDGRIIVWNRAAERLFGYTIDEIQVGGIPLLVPPDKAEERAAFLPAIEAGGSIEALETVRVARDGRRIDLSLSVFPIRDAHGQVIALGSISRDIRDRKQAERALRESVADLQAVFAGAADGIVLIDDRLRVISYNAAAGPGLRAAKGSDVVAGDAMIPLVGKEYRAEYRRNLRRALAGRTLRFERDYRGGDGRRRWYEVVLNPVSLEDGTMRGVAMVSRDITARRRAEGARRLAEEYVRSIVRNVPMLIFAVDRQGNYTFSDGQALAALGTKPNEVVGQNVFQRWAGNEAITSSIRRALAGETVAIDVEVDDLMFDGRYSPLRDDRGEIVGALGVGTDITARRRAEEARHAAEEHLRTVAANAPVVLFAIDKDGIFTLSEGAGLAPLGLGPGEVVGKSVYDVYAAEPGVLAQVARCLAGEEFAAEVRIGDGLVFETRYSPARDAHGQVVGMTGVSVDITERRRSEQALLQAQKLESLGVLAGGIAHDFNNLLVSILGNAGLALMELSPQSAARETIHEIEVAGQRAADLARQMLAYSGKGRFVIQQVDLNELVEEMTHLLRVSIVKGATLHYDYGPGLPAIEGDATQIRQVVMNLVVNASDAIGAHEGVIRVSTGLMHADRAYLDEPYLDPELPEGEYVYVEVEDTGQGMDADTLGKIFDPFFTTKFTGRGLGLAAVLGIIRGHRGAIKVSSTPGKGTTFRLLLPALAAAPEASAAVADPGAWKGSGTILVIDDEETVRTVTARACRMFGFEVLTAADGEAGVELFRQHAGEVACVLLDMTMPRLNGEEAFRQIRAISPEARVLIMSGFDQAEAASRFAGQGVAGFVQKPYELSLLRDELRRVFES